MYNYCCYQYLGCSKFIILHWFIQDEITWEYRIVDHRSIRNYFSGNASFHDHQKLYRSKHVIFFSLIDHFVLPMSIKP